LDNVIGKILGLFSIIIGILLSLTGIGALFGIPLIAAGCVFFFAGFVGGILTFIVFLYFMTR
jgi:hypothetical protein